MPPVLLAPTPIEDATRREFITGVGAAALAAAFLAACGDDDAESAGSTRTVSHEFGTSEIPTDAERVVVLDGRPSFEHALALGFSPVAVGADALVDGELLPNIDFDIEGVPLVEFEVDYEALLTVSPDLIIGRNFAIEPQYDRLSEIAPVLPFTYSDPWRSQLEQLARWLEREQAATDMLDEYEAKVASVRERHPRTIVPTTIGILQWAPESASFFSLSAAYVHHQTATDLGGTVAATPEEFSIENVNELGAVGALLVVSADLQARRLLEMHPLWQTIPAVQRGHVMYTDFRINFGGVYAAMTCLDLFDELYAKLA